MYYYAIVDANYICTAVQSSADEVNSANYITISEEQFTTQSVVGQQFDPETGMWSEPEHWYYAFLNDRDVVEMVQDWGEELNSYNAIRIQTLDQSLVGMVYDRSTQTFRNATFKDMAAHSTDELNIGNTDECLTQRLANIYTKAQVDTAIADAELAGTDGADGEDGGYYTPSVDANGNLTWTASKEGMPSVTGVNIKGAQGEQGIQGVPGTPGANGQDGAPGADGADGQDGQDGRDGTTVVIGTVTTGEPGTNATVQSVFNEETNTLTLNITIPRGATGAQGATGATGATGAQGEKGEKGDKGDAFTYTDFTPAQLIALKGAKGDKGDKGDTGATGAQGAKGDKGDTGATGAQGAKGDKGDKGDPGDDFDGNLIGAILRLNGVQTAYYNGTRITLGSGAKETYVTGTKLYCNQSWTVASDATLKENVATVDVDACVAFINALAVKTYNYKGSSDECIGVIAQDVQTTELAKYFVSKYLTDEGADEKLAVKVADLVFPLIVTVQQLYARVAKLEQK